MLPLPVDTCCALFIFGDFVLAAESEHEKTQSSESNKS